MTSVTDLFAGGGGSGLGATAVDGVDLYLAANHSARAIETHQLNFPDTLHDCADISQVEPRRYRRTDILWASPECFTAGHMITTARGQIPIEDVKVDDLALTHCGRWRRVVRTQNRQAPTVIVKGQGHTGIEVTASHRFWLRSSRRVWNNAIRDSRRQYATADWMAVGDAIEHQALWATPTEVEARPTLTPPAAFGMDLTEAWWLVGRWVGDGSLTFGRNHEVLIACGFQDVDELRAHLDTTATTWAESKKRTAMVFSVGDAKARNWLHDHFGHGAANKALPAWTLSLPQKLRQALLDGYISADGCMKGRRVTAATVSRGLAVSMRLLAESLGHRVSMGRDKRTTYRIEGRTGVAKPQWTIAWEPTLSGRRALEAFEDSGMAWSRIRSVVPGSDNATVYNIEVEEDHSYVLDGIVVANCTNHSQAKGRKLPAQETGLFGNDDQTVAERSRSTMWDVPRFAEVHRYDIVIVENVIEAANWAPFRAWLMSMDLLGYDHKVVSLNSMHAPAIKAPRAPQSRDRMYVIFWRKGNTAPNLDIRPDAWCATCEEVVRGVQSWKNGKRIGKYHGQYEYRCPNVACRNAIVEPFVLPAAAAIDWDLLGQRIGDRGKPLAPKTVARIKAGLERYAVPQLVPAGGTWNDSAQPVSWPMRTRTTRETEGLLVPVEGRDSVYARPADLPMRTQTTRHQGALVVPYYGTAATAHSADEPIGTLTTRDRYGLAFIAELRGGHSTARDVRDPLATVCASGNHHMLVRNNTPRSGDGGYMSTPVTEPARTVMASARQSLVGWPHDGPAVDDCTFRMLAVQEIQAAMAFKADYVITGSKREQVHQLGNGVTPPAAEWLIRAAVDSLGEAA